MLREEAGKSQGTPRFSTEESGKSWGFGTENKLKKYHRLTSPSLCKNPHSNNDVFGELGPRQTCLGGGQEGWEGGELVQHISRGALSWCRLFRAAECRWQPPSAPSAQLSSGQM